MRLHLGLDVDDLRFHRRSARELRASWKIAVEDSLECHHCALLNHPGFVEAVDDRALRLEPAGARLSRLAPVDARACGPLLGA